MKQATKVSSGGMCPTTCYYKPVLLVFIIVLSEILSQTAVVEGASVSTSNHNRFRSDKKLQSISPEDEDLLEEEKELDTSNIKRSRGRDNFDSKEFERFGSASGRPLSTSARENLMDIRDKTNCPTDFQGLCRCGTDSVLNLGRMYVVNCTNAGFSSAQVLSSIPQNTQALIFTGNTIPNLPQNIFGTSATFPDLVYVDLSNNGIKNIPGKSFHRVNSVETLILNYNKISRSTLLHKRIFSNFVNLKNLQLTAAFEPNSQLVSDLSEVFIESNLTRLEKLHLESNRIDYISEPTVFCELPSLMDLHLAQNILSDLNVDLTCLKRARYVDLTFNKIRTIPEQSGLWKLLHEQNLDGDQIRVNLMYNPFDCDCRLDPFLELVRNWTKINPDLLPSEERLTCDDGLPKNNTRLYLKDVVYTECPILEASDFGSTAVSIIAWLLAIVFVLVISFFLYTNQHLLCRPVSPLHQTTTQGVKYTTIKEEEAEVAHV